MTRDDVLNNYFEWLYNIVCERRYPDDLSYRKLLMKLHNTDFSYPITLQKDKARAADGVDLRYRFAQETNRNQKEYNFITDCLNEPCSMLEMMVALSLRIEETIMDDPTIGNRTSQWFWCMIANLGLGHMSDGRYDEKEVDYIIERFLNRDYEPNGKGGLFTIKNCEYDLRDVEIWTIMLWYLDSII